MSILEPALAQKIIDKMTNHLDYNINIMNEKGIIIASKDFSRIGDFHEVAYGLLNGTHETGVVIEDKKYLGTKPGINMFIDYNNKHVGVICVTGNPKNIHAFAGLVKNTMEAMLEYEIQMERKRNKISKVEKFLYYLLFEGNIDMTLAHSMAKGLQINIDVIRVAIIIKCNEHVNATNIVETLLKTKGHLKSDLVTIARNDDIIIFKEIENNTNNVISNYRSLIKEYLYGFMEDLSGGLGINDFSFYVGLPQRSLEKYRSSYEYAQEISLHLQRKRGIYFFEDHIQKYFRNLVTIKTYDEIFGIYNDLFTDEEKKLVSETVEILNNNNYNVVSSAKDLSIHRNTLVFRLNKIKNTFNIDPITNADNRIFLNEIAYYFRHK